MSNIKKPNKRIVYVDDQRDNLIVFEAQMAESWDVKAYINAADALRELKEYDPAIIISDMKMGKINGVEFLRQGREIVPNAVRLILTGYSDEELMISAIRYAYIFDYIRKPYDPDDVQIRLEKALNQYQENIKKAREDHSSNKAYKMIKEENEQYKDLLRIKTAELEYLKKEHSELKQNILISAKKINLKKVA